MDVLCVVQAYLNKESRNVTCFKSNMPGPDWLSGFMKRHSAALSTRVANNIKRTRAAVSKESLTAYHDQLARSLQDLDAASVFNYDETNLSDNPHNKK